MPWGALMHRLLALAVASVFLVTSAAWLTAAAAPAGAVNTPNKLVIVYMENHGLGAVTNPAGMAAMPYLNSLWNDPATEQFTNYYAVNHPSFPNYSALASGLQAAPNDTSFTAGQFNDPTLWDQLTAAGDSWGVYLGSAPSSCYAGLYYDDTTDTDTGPYKIGHNPAIPFAGVYNNASECQNVQPLTAMNDASLPDVSFVAPNLCDDMHGVTATQAAAHGYVNCVTGTTSIEMRADNWLAANVPAWTAAGADVLITFDEGTGTTNQVYSVLTGPGVTGGTNGTSYNHYSILAGVEDSYGLPLLGNAATATPIAFVGGGVTPPPPSSCPGPPSGNSELSGNVSVESSQTGWTGVYNANSAVTRVQPASGSYDGSWALQAALKPGTMGAAGLGNAMPFWLTSTTAGQTYTGSVFVQGSVTGEKATLLLREITPGGTVVSTSKVTASLLDAVWQRLTTTYTAQASGDSLRYSVYVSNLASSGQNFRADCLSLWAPSPGG